MSEQLLIFLYRSLLCWVLLLFAGVQLANCAPAERIEKRTVPKFLRVKEVKGEPTELQTAVARYRSAGGTVEVDVVGVIHIADPAYFRVLSERFKTYDVVLYELVAPPDKLVPERDAQSEGGLAALQNLMTDVLGLVHQLKSIDYSPKNFLHADLSPEGMEQALAERGETPLSIALGVSADMVRSSTLGAASSSSSSSSSGDLTSDFDRFVEIATDPDGSRKLKQELARQFAADQMGGSIPKAIEQSLIQDRNSAAMAVFDRELTKRQAARASGAAPVRIAIFYGAAHLNDFHSRLVSEYPLVLAGVDWVTAWDMSKPETASPAVRFLYKSLGETLRELMAQPNKPIVGASSP